MIVRVIEGSALTSADVSLWTQIQLQDPALASPFFSPGFTRIVAAARDDVHVAALEKDGETVGFFPFQPGRLGAGRPVGWTISDYQGVVIRPGVEWDPKDLLRGCGLKTWEFDHVLASQAPLEPFHQRRRESPYMDLSTGYEAYLEARRAAGGSEIANARRKMRKLEREVGPLRFEVHVDDRETLATLMRWKSGQYASTGAADVLARPWVAAVLERAHATQGDHFAGVLSTLHAGDHLVAAHLGLRSGSVWHYWFPAYDPAFSSYSPGLALLLKMAEAAPGVGLGAIDLGKGDARYKRSLMSGAVPLAEGAVELPSLAAVATRMRRSARHVARRTALGRPARRALARALCRGR
jgi:CelD/BcsL family acetyltransferase involved in cellulose biosynthesis